MIAAPGLVSLVGAGPGDPDLLTVKAARRLRQADVVLHDALVSPDVIALAASARRIDVGKRGGRASTSQSAIEALMIDAARRGSRVVRLKGGDPFVFGRGGEEVLALQRAGIPFEIVPGVSTAIAAPALGGIPVTHRGVASAVLVVNGADPDVFDLILSSFSPGPLTIVVMMGVNARAAIVEALLHRGWAAGTPAAMLLGASTPGEWTWRGALASLGGVRIPATAAHLPGTLLIGDVAGLPISLVNGVQGEKHVCA